MNSLKDQYKKEVRDQGSGVGKTEYRISNIENKKTGTVNHKP